MLGMEDIVRVAPGPAQSGTPDRRRWLVLAVGVLAMIAGCTFQNGLAYLIPTLRSEGLSLSAAGMMTAAPTVGLLLTLVAWGAAADRFGERWVMASGLGLAGAILAAASMVDGHLALGSCLLLAGAASACVHASSGRLILGWFAADERGVAMGLRQAAQPIGVAIAAVALPTLAGSSRAPALLFLAASCLVGAGLVAIAVRDPQRGQTSGREPTGSPYRTPVLWRIHASSALLIVPQFTVSTYALIFFVDALDWHPAAAGRILAIAQIGGAAIRLGCGWWSDRVGSRMRPMRHLSIVIAVTVATLAAGAATHSRTAIAMVLVAAVVTVSTNGLAYTAVAEYAGRGWAGKALGIQNTAQNAVAAVTPPLMAAVISAGSYATAFAAAAVFPLVAAITIPARAEGRASLAGGVGKPGPETVPRPGIDRP